MAAAHPVSGALQGATLVGQQTDSEVSPLRGVRGKLGRAEEHLRDLEAMIIAYEQEPPHRAVLDPNPIYRAETDRDSVSYSVVAAEVKPVPTSIPLRR